MIARDEEDGVRVPRDFWPGRASARSSGGLGGCKLCVERNRPLRGMQGKVPIFEPSRPYIEWVRDTFRGSARNDGADTMSNLDNPNEINILDEGLAALSRSDEEQRREDETLAEYLTRSGASAVHEESVFAGVKKPKRPKPTFVFPTLPSLF